MRATRAATPATSSAAMRRRSFLVGAAALIAATGYSAGAGSPAAASGPAATRRPCPGGLALKGINFYTDREVWRPEFVRREIETIRADLHCNSILLLGSDLDRLVESASIAAEQGLHVWFEPRAFEANASATLEFLTAVAGAAGDLRADHPDVGLSVGCELSVFMAGLVPGDDWQERGAAFGEAVEADSAAYRRYTRRLNDFLADALATVRPLFDGQVTYTSEASENVDWSDFDVVGVDLYRHADNEATYVDHVRRLHRHGKPVVITEFGCCSYQGAEDKGGMGFDIIDYNGTGLIVGDPVRDEQVQADYIDDLLDVYEAEGVHGAFVYEFIAPDSPYSPETQHDYDMASFSVVKVEASGTELAYDTTGHFEPKRAFHTLARRFA